MPVFFTQPIPEGPEAPGEFSFRGGLGDLLLELLLAPPAAATGLPKNLILGGGVGLGFPTSTTDELGQQQFTAGPAVVLGWKTKRLTAVAFPTYLWGYADRSDRDRSAPDVSSMQLLYALIFNLPQAWQIGMNPTIAYNNKAASGDKWNVPIGVTLAKTTKIGPLPVKFQLGAEYSVVNQDDYGKRWLIKLNIIPVIAPLIKEPLF